MWLSHDTIIIRAIFYQYISNECKIHQLREENLAWSCFKTQMWRDLLNFVKLSSQFHILMGHNDQRSHQEISSYPLQGVVRIIISIFQLYFFPLNHLYQCFRCFLRQSVRTVTLYFKKVFLYANLLHFLIGQIFCM